MNYITFVRIIKRVQENLIQNFIGNTLRIFINFINTINLLAENINN